MTLISCAVTTQLICVFVFAYAKSRFSHEAVGPVEGRQGQWWLSGRLSLDSGVRGPGFEPHNRRIVSLSKTL